MRLTLRAASAGGDRTDERSLTLPTLQHARSRDQTRVLIVDDDRLVRRFMSDSLRSLQYQVTDAENGEQALAAMEGERFDLLLVDFAMPGMNGADVARAAQNRQPGLKVLMVSGYADSAAVESALGSARLPSELSAREDATLEAARALSSGSGEVFEGGEALVEPRPGVGGVGPAKGANRTVRRRGTLKLL